MKWLSTTVATPHGPEAAVAPLVISASRATDIPAFHAKWLLERLRAGYCLWENPFNPRQNQWISFEKCAVIVFWSKDPRPLLPYLPEIEARGCRFYFQYTLNDYEREGLEPRIPALARRVAAFQELSARIGRERVIWRFDPVIVGDALTVESIVERVHALAEQLAPYTEKLVFSFLDMYRKTAARLKKLEPQLRAPSPGEARRFTQALVRLNATLAAPLKLATCAENPGVLLPGVEANACIDPGLLVRLCPGNAEIERLYGGGVASKQGYLVTLPGANGKNGVKDRGQRAFCGCAPSKDIGGYNTCMHLCAYCYANGEEARVIRRFNAVKSGSERL